MTHPDTAHTGASRPSWDETVRPFFTAPLTRDLTVDVCVVGAGLAGLTTAYLLAREGRRVAVLDQGPVGGGNTGRTTAQLANAFDDRYSEVIRLYGEAGARAVAQSHTAAIDLIERISQEEGIACDFERVSGYLFVPPGASRRVLSEELEAARRAGLREVAWVDKAPLEGFDTLPCLHFPNQAQFDPMRYLRGLAHAFGARGGELYTETAVQTVEGGAPAKVRTHSGLTVTAGAVVVATNAPIHDRVATHTKQAPYLSFVIAAEVPRGSVQRALYWDTEDPYHYVRLQSLDEATELLLVGGEDHKTGQADDAPARYGRLEAWARERFPKLGRVRYRWSGQVYETLDGLAFIGRSPGEENVYLVTGDSGMGMTHGSLAGVLLRDLILGRDNPWATLYDPARKPLKAGGAFLKENLNVAAQFLDLATPARGDAAALGPGEGAVVGFGPAKRAVYRDEAGVLHERSAICPHLGCVVAWNSAERTWDCPCHGSRFDAYGRVINGPAHRGLEPK
ncbi:FAD-dependent oxidoreductase [Truepera radiovictrix]|uniref:FAD dependent oxidoreductase n=1 Tax=Truepera radiovictrix (strain DSM 17093 / CIP 108686 / LMG 22925 / RQ-24) TaxID=649638 RepID=D7CTI3_TRURR|nr:FAD-dependent oxidoreductase [Truepera radiovictrix]ADI13840.1 FAD dependent oxidoreductase [Truepera radiovictrix DSM 17093]WMT57595.1 FAD-dependent oxidoreductase [Truepera radiovictrix]